MLLSEYLSSPVKNRNHVILIGHPVSHSLSPLMHNTSARHHGLNVEYVAVDVPSAEINRLPRILQNRNLIGANVTIPYKKQIISMVDHLTEVAETIGAVNTLFRQDTTICGHNTDAYGFNRPILERNYDLQGERAVIFGTGGATKAIIYALAELGLTELVLVSRNPGRISQPESSSVHITLTDYNAWTAFAEEARLIVNATPLGMPPHIEQSPVNDGEISILSTKICYDIVYNPQKTHFLGQAEEAGAETIGGLEMLIHQGSKSFQKWTGKEFPISLIQNELNKQLA